MTDPAPPKPGQTPQPGIGEPDKLNGTATVVVGCKLPNGMICEVGRPGDDNHRHVRLNGSNANVVVGADGKPVVGGYGLTTVSKQFWDEWLKTHKRLDFVRNGFVFVHNDMASARDHAHDLAGKRNGFEAVDPNEKVLDREGRVILETDAQHLAEGRQAIANAQRAANR